MLEGVANNVNGSTERKNVFLAANQDYLLLSSNEIIDVGNTATIVFSVPNLIGDPRLCDGEATNNNIELAMLSASGRIYVGMGLSAGYSFKLNGLPATTFGSFEFYFNDGTTFLDHLGEQITLEITRTGGVDRGIQFVNCRRGLSGFGNATIYNFTINGEQFGLNEGNGANFSSEDGSITGTRITSHSDNLNYINSQVIQTIYGTGIQRKNVLVAANQDYLSLDSTVILEDGKSFIFNILVDSLSTTQVIGSMDDSSTYISKNSGDIFVKLPAGGFLTSGVVIGDNEIVLRKSGTTYYTSVNGGVESSRVDVGDFKMEQTSKLGASFFNGLTILDLTLNSETFALNEGNGVDSYSDKKTNEYKNVLVSANQDYLQLGNVINLELGEYIELEVDVDYSGGNVTFCANGGSEDYIGVLADGRLFVQQNSLFNTATTTTIPLGHSIIKYRRALTGENFISANGGVEQELTVLDNSTFGLFYFARRTGVFNDFSLFKFSINSETFALNEPSGANFTGSNGTTGTRNTSHSDSLEYINNSMIKGDGWNKVTRNTSHSDGLNYINHELIKPI